MGIEFQFCNMKKFYRSFTQQCEYTSQTERYDFLTTIFKKFKTLPKTKRHYLLIKGSIQENVTIITITKQQLTEIKGEI